VSCRKKRRARCFNQQSPQIAITPFADAEQHGAAAWHNPSQALKWRPVRRGFAVANGDNQGGGNGPTSSIWPGR